MRLDRYQSVLNPISQVGTPARIEARPVGDTSVLDGVGDEVEGDRADGHPTRSNKISN